MADAVIVWIGFGFVLATIVPGSLLVIFARRGRLARINPLARSPSLAVIPGLSASPVCRWPLVIGVAAMVSGGCIARDRLNAECAWSGPAADLRTDIDVVEELGVRYGDAARAKFGLEEARRRRAECTDRLLGEVAKFHQVDVAQVTVERGRRPIAFDVAAVVLPLCILLLGLSAAVGVWIARRFAMDEPWPRRVTLAIASIVVAGAWFQIAAIWSGVAEALRLRDDHLSYRAFYLPWSRHPFVVVAAGMLLFWITAITVTRRTKDQGHRHG